MSKFLVIFAAVLVTVAVLGEAAYQKSWLNTQCSGTPLTNTHLHVGNCMNSSSKYLLVDSCNATHIAIREWRHAAYGANVSLKCAQTATTVSNTYEVGKCYPLLIVSTKFTCSAGAVASAIVTVFAIVLSSML